MRGSLTLRWYAHEEHRNKCVFTGPLAPFYALQAPLSPPVGKPSLGDSPLWEVPMRNGLFVIPLMLVSSGLLYGQDFFHFECKPPYQGPPHDVDRECGNSGDAEDLDLPSAKIAAEVAQNLAKDNLCLTGTPTLVTIADLIDLQDQVDNLPNFPYGNSHRGQFGPPEHRELLTTLAPTPSGKHLAEGDLVRYVGFLVEAHYAGAESVNCSFTDRSNVDIHVALFDSPITITKKEKAATKNPKLCKTISAEVIPHHRPTEWELPNLLDQTSEQQVRITGQLFFDGSHHPKPCSGSLANTGDPVRTSSWEIHPVYTIEVCTKSTPCAPNGTVGWEVITLPVDETDEQ